MDSKLVEEIEAALPSAETARVNPDSSPTDTACAKCLEKDLLLQRCLESLRWIPVEKGYPEIGQRVLIKGTDGFVDIDEWIEIREAPVSFSTITVPVDVGWADSDIESVVAWLPIPQ